MEKVKMWFKKITFGITVTTLGTILGGVILFFCLVFLFGCKHTPEPNIPYALQFYDKSVKNFPNTNE